MANSLKLTRNQLAGFLKDFEQIKQFEKLFSLSEDYLNSGLIDGIALDAGNATAAAYAVAADLQALADLTGIEDQGGAVNALAAQVVAIRHDVDMIAFAPANAETPATEPMGRAKLRFVA